MVIDNVQDNPVRVGALSMASMGMPVHPVHGVIDGCCTCKAPHADKPKERGKHPAMGLTFKNAVFDASTIDGWFAAHPNLNYGVATGVQVPGTEKMVIVIDVDSYKAGAEDVLSKFEGEYGKLPETAEVLTGGGGRHLYFYAALGTRFNSKLGHEGIDIKGIGGYVLGPGSRHLSGKTYEWEASSDPTEGQLIADLPQWVYDKFAKVEPSLKGQLPQLAVEIPGIELTSIQANLRDIPADSREVWLEVLMALKNGSDSEEMFALADQWSSTSSSYRGTGDVRKVWDGLTRDGGVTIKTVARLAGAFRYQASDVDTTKMIAKLDEKAKTLTDQWPDIDMLDAMSPAAPYPLDALPLIMQDAVGEVRDYTQAPLAMVACAALSALSLAAQGLYDVKRDEGLTGPTGLFVLAIAESGERKSTLDSHFMKPIHVYEATCAEDAKPAIKQFNTDMQAWEATNKGLLGKLENAARSAESKPTDKIKAELDQHHERKPEAPTVPRLIYGDTTTEALTSGLGKTWPSAGVVSSEGGVVFGGHGMKADNQMGSLGMLNALWDGNPIPIDRRTSQSFAVRGARLTVAIQVQPATFEAFMKAAQLARGSGFIARFLVAYPESTQGTRMYRRPPAQWPKRDAFCASLSDLLNTPAAIVDGALQPTMLALTEAAMDVWVEFYNRIERQLGNGGAFSDVKDVASKTADNAARIAALFRIAEGGHGDIQADQMRGAVRVAEWHLCESQRVLAATCCTPRDREEMELLDWLVTRMKEAGTLEISMTDVSQLGPNKFRKKPARQPVVDRLVAQGYARVTIGKPQMVTVNPKLLG